MRPLSWTIRVSLFAIGFGLGLSQYKPAPPQRPIVFEIHLALPDRKATEPIVSHSTLQCEDTLPMDAASSQTTRARL
jgi:hypothetical protein